MFRWLSSIPFLICILTSGTLVDKIVCQTQLLLTSLDHALMLRLVESIAEGVANVDDAIPVAHVINDGLVTPVAKDDILDQVL